jgi:hypothetical protein
MTGSLSAGEAAAGRHMLTNRQSSDEVVEIGAEPGGNAACAQSAPNALASRTPSHAGMSWVGRQRLAPTGAAA